MIVNVLPAESISGLRAELAVQDPAARLQRRLLDFAPLTPAPLPTGLELPDQFVAVRFEHCPAYPDTEENRELVLETICELAERSAVVVLDWRHTVGDVIGRLAEDERVHFVDEADPNAAAAILARACGFVGSYGPTAYAAALMGVPATALYSRREAIASTDLRVAASFLARPPFGRLVTVDATGPANETATHVANLLEPAGRVLAGAS